MQSIELAGPKRVCALVTKIRRGINKFGHLPREIAELLQKTNPKHYTGHSIRRTAATWLTANGANKIQFKTFGRWKSTNVTMGYVGSIRSNK